MKTVVKIVSSIPNRMKVFHNGEHFMLKEYLNYCCHRELKAISLLLQEKQIKYSKVSSLFLSFDKATNHVVFSGGMPNFIRSIPSALEGKRVELKVALKLNQTFSAFMPLWTAPAFLAAGNLSEIGVDVFVNVRFVWDSLFIDSSSSSIIPRIIEDFRKEFFPEVETKSTFLEIRDTISNMDCGKAQLDVPAHIAKRLQKYQKNHSRDGLSWAMYARLHLGVFEDDSKDDDTVSVSIGGKSEYPFNYVREMLDKRGRVLKIINRIARPLYYLDEYEWGRCDCIMNSNYAGLKHYLKKNGMSRIVAEIGGMQKYGKFYRNQMTDKQEEK